MFPVIRNITVIHKVFKNIDFLLWFSCTVIIIHFREDLKYWCMLLRSHVFTSYCYCWVALSDSLLSHCCTPGYCTYYTTWYMCMKLLVVNKLMTLNHWLSIQVTWLLLSDICFIILLLDTIATWSLLPNICYP